MILGMMQPYFFPYLGYYALIQKTDTWVVFDDCQYIRHGWVNRNRILHPNNSWQYITVPIAKAKKKTPINQIMIDSQEWGDFILRQLIHYKKKAPLYDTVIKLLAESFFSAPRQLDKLLVHLLKTSCNYLGLNFEPILNSSIKYDRSAIKKPGDWALTVAKTLNIQKYINPVGGRAVFQNKEWVRAKINLEFLTFPITPYPQAYQNFVPHLSIIDVMMFNTPKQIHDMLTNTTIISVEE